MPITSFTIGGVEVDPLLENFEIRETTGNVSTLTCDVESLGSPVQRFSVHDPIVVQEDGVTIFAGTLTQTREQGAGGPNLYDPESGAPQIVTTVTAEDYTRIAERVYVTMTVAAGTLLKAALTSLVDDYLDQFGVTLDASQVNGPALPAMTFTRVLAKDVLKAFSDATNYLWRIDYDKPLRMWAEGDLTAPFDIDEFDDPPSWTGDVEVEQILGDTYANRVTVVVDPVRDENHVETFPGDGVTSTFQLQYTLTKSPGIIHIYQLDGVTPAGGETFGIPPASPIQWSYDPVTNQITRTIGPTDASKIYSLTFDGTFQAIATAEDAGEIAANGLYEYVESRNDITSTAAAQALADALLAQRLTAGEQNASYDTRRSAPTIRAGQQQTIEATARGLSGTYIITDLQISAETPANDDFAAVDLGLIRHVTVKRDRTSKWQDTFHDWLSDQSGSGVSNTIGTGVPASIGAGPPIKAVQFNRDGSLGGDGDFTYDEATNSIAMGGGGTNITAANPESCGAFGYDCHVADA